MDRDAILEQVPSGDELRAVPPYRRKEAAETLIRSILDGIGADGREPDRWEAEHLAQALGYIISRWYFAAIASAEKALALSEERAAPETWGRTDETASVRDFRVGLEYVETMSAPAA